MTFRQRRASDSSAGACAGHRRKDERDRRIAIRPRRVSHRRTTPDHHLSLDDQGVSGQRAKIVVRRDGEVISERTLVSADLQC